MGDFDAQTSIAVSLIDTLYQSEFVIPILKKRRFPEEVESLVTVMGKKVDDRGRGLRGGRFMLETDLRR